MHPCHAQVAHHLVPVDVRQHRIEDDDVVVVELADLERVLAEIGAVDDKIFFAQRQLDIRGGDGIGLDQQYSGHHGPPGGYRRGQPPRQSKSVRDNPRRDKQQTWLRSHTELSEFLISINDH